MQVGTMKYVVGFTGTHGTGKSTLLKEAKDHGFAISEEQLSRAAQKMLGWESLSKAQESESNMWALQDAVMTAMYDRDRAIEEAQILTVVDRTPADIWAYTSLWCSRLGINTRKNERAVKYKNMCRELSKRYNKFVYVPIIEEIPFVAEANRADLESRAFVDNEIKAFLWDGQLPTYIIHERGLFERSCEVQALLTVLSVWKYDGEESNSTNP